MVNGANTAKAGIAGKFRVLVIEDDAHIGRLVEENMKKAGFVCRTEASGRTGLAAFAQMHPQLVVLDLNLPDLNGYEVCDRIRQDSTVPIIMMTARDGADDQLHGFKVGADDYITKPFDPKLLMARCVAQLRRVYRYDAPPELPVMPPAPNGLIQVPEGWARCEACSYMGPHEKFEDLNTQGMVILSCPNCDARVTEGMVLSY
ncbi:MAG: response regulator transcription factor [Abitibacteriaceae bacterium]|nr:response regulator transcription factor [Abditibacteriaceae bacterium]MBV9868560.1 response regulator transcription factor [Abditibacteriaceae bacterium]